METISIHEAAGLFPLLKGAELKALADDIAENGLWQPISRWRGQIIDGRNRLAACELAGIKPTFEDIDDDVDPWAFVVSMNIARRHLTGDQRRLLIGRAARAMGEVATRGGRGGRRVSAGNTVPTIAERATKLGVSKGEVSKAIKAADDYDSLSEDLQVDVCAGRKNIAQAKEIHRVVETDVAR